MSIRAKFRAKKPKMQEDKSIDYPVLVIYGTTYSMIDQVKFVEDCLYKI